MTLAAVELVRRFALHVVPGGLVPTRVCVCDIRRPIARP